MYPILYQKELQLLILPIFTLFIGQFFSDLKNIKIRPKN